ncbi:MAG: hypothetical protein NC121_08645 [Blautia sp.]|nr:hypothetical protein [Blautia sp.]
MSSGKDKPMENNTTDSKLMRELKFTRVICMISSVLTLCLLAGGILLSARVRELGEACAPVVEKVSQLDVESLNATLVHVNDTLETVDWNRVAESLGELDVEALNSTIERLDVDAINSAIEGLDTAELTQALKTLNDAVEKIRELSDKLGEAVSWLGGLFH